VIAAVRVVIGAMAAVTAAAVMGVVTAVGAIGALGGGIGVRRRRVGRDADAGLL